jgi:hypothetical protein
VFSFSVRSETDSIRSEKKWLIGLTINNVEPGIDFVIKERLLAFSHRKSKSYCIGTNIGYQLKNNMQLRFSVKYTSQYVEERHDSRESSPSSSGFELRRIDAKQSVFHFLPGLIWSAEFHRLKFLGGFQVGFRDYGQIQANTWEDTYSSSSQLEVAVHYDQKEEGGYSIGFGPVIGTSISLSKRFSIGGELNAAFCYNKLGGMVSTTKTIDIVGSSHTVDTSKAQVTYKGFDFAPVGVSINLNYAF